MKDLNISKILKIFDKIKLTNPKIEYQDLKGNNINETNQKSGLNFKIKITANSNDLNYTGEILTSYYWTFK